MLVATTDGVSVFLRHTDGEWRLRNRALEGTFVSSLTLLQDGTLVAGTHGLGLARSTDGGRSWSLANRGMTVYDVWVVKACTFRGRERIYAGTLPARLFVSDDGGDHWKELPALANMPRSDEWAFPPAPHVAHVLSIEAQGDTLFVGIEVGALLRSDDGGASFTDMQLDPDVSLVDIHAIAVHPARPGRLVAATGLWGIIRSENGGGEWDRSPVLPGIDYPVPLAIHPVDADTLYVAGGRGFPPQWYQLGRSRARIARSRDGGRTWEHLWQGLPAGQRPAYGALAVSSWSGGTDVYAADTDGTIWESRDGGEHWHVAAEAAPVSKGEQYRGMARNRGASMTAVDQIVFSAAGQQLIDQAAKPGHS